ncbi:MAG: rod-binding protein [Stappiaceae bacterium]
MDAASSLLQAQSSYNQARLEQSTSRLSAETLDKIDAKAQEFESVFLQEMFSTMFTGLDEGGTYGNGPGADAWQSMLVEQYAKGVSESGGIGIAAAVKRELIALQEGATQ